MIYGLINLRIIIVGLYNSNQEFLHTLPQFALPIQRCCEHFALNCPFVLYNNNKPRHKTWVQREDINVYECTSYPSNIQA